MFKRLLCRLGFHDWYYYGRRYYAFKGLVGGWGGRRSMFRKRKSRMLKKIYPTNKHVWKCTRKGCEARKHTKYARQ